jgi:hypothetical protein
MARKTGVTKETTKRIVLDAGVIYTNWNDPDNRKVLGACRGGNTFTVETEFRDIPFDGVSGLVEGARRIISATATLKVNLVEINKDLLEVAIPGAKCGNSTPATDEQGVTVTGENYYEIRRFLEKTIPDFEYIPDIALVAEYSGTKSPIVLGIENAMNNSSFEVATNDADEVVIALEFTGAYDPENMAKEPWFILMPEKLPVA